MNVEEQSKLLQLWINTLKMPVSRMFGGQKKDLQEMTMGEILENGKINLNSDNFIISQPDITAI